MRISILGRSVILVKQNSTYNRLVLAQINRSTLLAGP